MMKKCNFCDFCGRTERDEQVCTKRLIYVGDLKDYPCSDFSIKLRTTFPLVVLGLSIAALFILFLTS